MKEFVEKLAADGELLVVNEQVDPRYELAAVTKKIQTTSDKAVLFKNVAGTRLPVVSNLYGSHDRLCRLIGASSDAFCPAWAEALRAPVPPEIYEHVGTPQDVVECALSELPLITYHGKDAGPYFTSAIFLALEPDTRVPNLSFHRSMYVSDQELRVRLGSSHDLARYQKKAEQRGEEPRRTRNSWSLTYIER